MSLGGAVTAQTNINTLCIISCITLNTTFICTERRGTESQDFNSTLILPNNNFKIVSKFKNKK
jgi:hypothetical protein